MGRFNLSSFSNFFGTNDNQDVDASDDHIDDEKQSKPKKTSKIVSMQEKRKVVQSTISVFEPLLYSDVKKIATKLINNNAVIINFERADSESIKRMIDFLNGTVFTIDGSIERISAKVFLFTPHNYEVDGNLRHNLNHRY